METNPTLQSNRFTLAFRDMGDVSRYLIAYRELEELQAERGDFRYFDHCEAILIAAIVAYCRCFLKSQSEGNASRLLRKTDFDCIQAKSNFSELHDRIIEKRHTAIAHSDWGEHNTQLLEVKGNSVLRRTSVPKFTHGIDPTEFVLLAEAVRSEAMIMSHRIDTGDGDETAA